MVLDYNLVARGEKPLYEYLYQRIRDDIVSGAIGAGERLPSKRALARHLGVSVITVEGAYAQLVAEGYVSTKPRSGYFVRALPGPPAAPARAVEPAAAPVPATADTGAAPALLADLASDALPRAEASRLWARGLRQALAAEPEGELFSPAPAQGTERLRVAIASHLRQTRGMEVDPSRVVVGAGAQVLDTMIVQLLGRDLTFAVEDPGYPRLTRLYRAGGVRVRHVPLDEEGVCVGALAEKRVDVLHLMPSHQFPTGRVTSIARRYELLGWAAAAPGRYLVEDDYDCEFRLAGRPVPALASVDTCERVIYTNTFSKSLGSALRLAYMVLPPTLAARYASELGFYSSTVSSVDQVTLARLLESGDYDRLVARERTRMRALRDELVAALEASALAGRMYVEEADSGLHFVLAVASERNEAEIARRARERGVVLAPLSDFAWCPENRTRPDGLRRFVVQYGGLSSAAVPQVVAVLEEAVG